MISSYVGEPVFIIASASAHEAQQLVIMASLTHVDPRFTLLRTARSQSHPRAFVHSGLSEQSAVGAAVGRETIGTAVGRVDGFLVKKVGLELGSLDGSWDGLAESGIAVGMNEGSIVSGAISEKQICHPPLVTL